MHIKLYTHTMITHYGNWEHRSEKVYHQATIYEENYSRRYYTARKEDKTYYDIKI